MFLSFNLPSYPYVPVDSDVVPMILGIILLGLSVALFFIDDQNGEENNEGKINKRDLIILISIFVLINFYILFLEIIGFIISTTLFIFVCSFILGYRKNVVNLIVAIVVPLSFYLLFTEALQIRLPQGIMPF